MGLLSSPRRRRRLRWLGLTVGIAAPLIFLGVHYSNPGDPGNANGPLVNEPGNTEPKHVPFAKQDQRAVTDVLREFELTAVDRQDVGRSWEISAPSLRQGLTRKQWVRGELPVVPYPAANHGLGRWSYVEYSYKNTVGLEVFLFPKPGSGWSAMTADVELVKGRDGKWRVDYWMPKKFHGPPAVAAKTKAKASKQVTKAQAAAKRSRRARTSAASAPEPTVTPKPSRIWWLVPIALLAFMVLAPIAIGTGIWYRNRRAARQWAR